MKVRYRIMDPATSDGDPYVREYVVVAKTPSGAWVVPSWSAYRLKQGATLKELRDDIGIETHFVLDGPGKRLCHETMEMARDSYRARKKRQARICAARLRDAEEALAWLDRGGAPKPEFPHFDLEAAT